MANLIGHQYEVGDVVEATFRPVAVTTLKPAALPLVERRCRWEALWALSPEDSGSYVGQMAWGQPARESLAGPTHPLAEVQLLWVPTEDLAEVVVCTPQRA